MTRRHYRRPAAIGAAGAVVVAAAALVVARPRRVVVVGASMEPALLAGDRLLVVRPGRVRPGDVVAALDPRPPRRPVVKRVGRVEPDGSVWLRGDNPPVSTDSRHFGAVARSLVWGRAVWRYGPEGRTGRLRRRAPDGGTLPV